MFVFVYSFAQYIRRHIYHPCLFYFADKNVWYYMGYQEKK